MPVFRILDSGFRVPGIRSLVLVCDSRNFIQYYKFRVQGSANWEYAFWSLGIQMRSADPCESHQYHSIVGTILTRDQNVPCEGLNSWCTHGVAAPGHRQRRPAAHLLALGRVQLPPNAPTTPRDPTMPSGVGDVAHVGRVGPTYPEISCSPRGHLGVCVRGHLDDCAFPALASGAPSGTYASFPPLSTPPDPRAWP